MQDVHLKIPTHFLLDGCMHLGYQILRLGDLYTDRNKEGRPRERGSIIWLQSGSTETVRLGHFVFGK